MMSRWSGKNMYIRLENIDVEKEGEIFNEFDYSFLKYNENFTIYTDNINDLVKIYKILFCLYCIKKFDKETKEKIKDILISKHLELAYTLVLSQKTLQDESKQQ